MAETKRKGRPSAYDPTRHPFLAQVLAREGLTEDEIAKALGVVRATLAQWKHLHPEFLDALKGGKVEADARVVDSLYRRACGYDFEETEIIADRTAEGQARPARVKRTKKHVPPDVTACIFWLKNREPERWRDVVRSEVTGRGGGPIEAQVKPNGDDPERIAGILGLLGRVGALAPEARSPETGQTDDAKAD